MLVSLAVISAICLGWGKHLKRALFLLSTEVGGIWFAAFAAGRRSAAPRAASAAWPRDWLGIVDRADGFWSEWQLRLERWRGWLGLWVEKIKWGGGGFGGGVGGQWFGICEEQQRCSCASAPWHFPNLITDEDRLPSLYLASTFLNLHRRISADKARLGKCRHPLGNS